MRILERHLLFRTPRGTPGRRNMRQLTFILVTSLIVSCMAEDVKKQPSNDPKMDQKDRDPKTAAADTKTMEDAKSMPTEASKSRDHPTTASKIMDHAMKGSKTMAHNMMDPKTARDAPGGVKSMQNAGHKVANRPNAQPKDSQTPKEDMKAEGSVGLGFYAGVVPIGYGGYGGYRGYGYGYPYYQSYYARPYYGYPSYRPAVPVLVKPRPIPVLLG